MNRIYLAFILLIIFSCEKGKRVVEYYDNGNVFKKYYEIDGRASGDFYEYYKNGNIKFETKYNDGLADGYYKEYSENGEIIEEGQFCKGEAVGWFKYYRNGKLKGKRQYILKNQKSTLNQFILFDENGNILKDSSNYISVKKSDTGDVYKVKLEASFFKSDYAEFLVGDYTSGFKSKNPFVDTIRLKGNLEATLDLKNGKKAIICDILPMDSLRKMRFIYFDPKRYEY